MIPTLMIVRSLLLTSLSMAAGARAAEEISFNRDIRPIFTRSCITCHGGIKEGGGISLVYREKALGKGESGKPAIVPGKPELSELIHRINSNDNDEIMPKPKKGEHGEKLPADEIAKLTEWIRQGAKWEDHWSFMPAVEPADPQVKHAGWAKTKADRLILAKMEAEGLAPSKEAPPAAWLRRVTLDLIGLPPSPEELEAFEKAAATDKEGAMAAVVDRLLASPQFGERWAAMWLDLARYSDTMGFEKDPGREVWPFRDWVIQAFNADLPFDEFTKRQLAGDLLPNPAPGDLIASAFQRNTMCNTEGGSDDEEYRTAAVMDRISTTWTVWQGTTFACVQCHGHPYDPFPHDDYYRFMAFFDNTEDCDLNNEFPKTKAAKDPAKQADAVRLEKEIRQNRDTINDVALSLAKQAGGWASVKADEVKASAATGKITQQPDGSFVATGTNPTNTVFTVTTPATKLGLLRLDILPVSDDPAKWSEFGAVVTKLEIDRVLPDGTKQPVKLKEVVSDFLAGPFEPNIAVQSGKGGGFGDYPALRGPRHAFFVPEAVEDAVPGTRFEIRLMHGVTCNETQGCVMRKFKLAISPDDRLATFVMSPERAQAWQKHAQLQGQYNAIPGTMVPVMEERDPAARRDTRVFDRGNRMTKSTAVNAGLPVIMRPPAKNENLSRLELAEWLTGERNTLTDRVLANRLWAELFGLGIVETLEDFGSSGLLPTNQPLLDHLALRLSKEHHWHLKPFLRELVLSAAYRQDDKATPELLAKDPRNRFIARGPRQRLSAEMVRDQALAASGLLSKKQFGPPVFPPQPDGIWKSVYSGAKWATSTGEDRYRRAVYTYQKRTSGYPAFLTFDAPTRDVCTARRIPTNTPLQALVTLNDPAFMELAQAFAKRMTATGSDLNGRIQAGYKLLTNEDASSDIVQTLAALHADAKTEFEKNPADSVKLAPTPDEAALVLVANTMFNLDSALTR
ncbi:cytochrome c [Luteolibacter sp. LG18]|nr:cytochrome c [Luteolibacter sp. LG18]